MDVSSLQQIKRPYTYLLITYDKESVTYKDRFNIKLSLLRRNFSERHARRKFLSPFLLHYRGAVAEVNYATLQTERGEHLNVSFNKAN